MDSKDVKGLISGVFLGFFFGMLFIIGLTSNFGILPEYHAAKEVCEKELPRTQVCGMTFVPVGEK